MTEREYAEKLIRVLKEAIDTNNSQNNFDWLRENSLAESDPDGIKKYCEKRIFKIKESLDKNSMYGQIWVANGCREDLFKTDGIDWLLKYTMINVKYVSEDAVWESLSKFLTDYILILNLKRLSKGYDQNIDEKHEKFMVFWMQFLNKKDSNGKPYMTKEDVVIFVDQAFCGKEFKKTFNPNIAKIQIQHGAHLFFHNYDFTKKEITRKLIENFPVLFDKGFKNEYYNVKNRPHKNRIFQFPPTK